MTNRDKINNMTNAELAKLINACDNYLCSECPYTDGFNCIRNSATVDVFGNADNSEAKEWLESEVANNANGRS